MGRRYRTNINQEVVNIMNPYFAEFLGTLVLILMGDGVCACSSLEKSKGKGAGWVVITLAWGLAVMCGVFIAGPYSGAHLNPAVTIGLAVAGSFPWASALGYIFARCSVASAAPLLFGLSIKTILMLRTIRTRNSVRSARCRPSTIRRGTSSASSSEPGCWCSAS